MKPLTNQTSKLAAQVFIDEGNQLLNSHNYTGALNAYNKAIEVDSTNPIAYHQRGWTKFSMEKSEEALIDWNKAIALNPSFADVYADRAALLVGKKDYASAIIDYNMVLQLQPEKGKLLQPIIDNINKKLYPKDHEAVDKFVEEEIGIKNGMNRADFLKSIGGLAATVALLTTTSGCNKVEGFNGKKGARWGFIIDLKRCVACKACVIACKNENKTPPGVAYNVFIEEEHGEFPHTSSTYFTRPCMHCAESSCTLVCPVSATYHRDDGIVVVDYNKCIGCRYCIAACPYGARSFDYGYNYIADPENAFNLIPSSEYNEKFGLRKEGSSPIQNVRKCMLCLHLQDEKGEYREAPACARTCMGKAIHFGDLADPNGKCLITGDNLQELLARRNHHRLKEEMGNEPNVYYLT